MSVSMSAEDLVNFTKIYNDCLMSMEENLKKNPKFYPETCKEINERILHEFGVWYQNIQTPSKDKTMAEIERIRTLKAIVIIGMIGIMRTKYNS